MPGDYNDLLKAQNNFTKPEKNDSMEMKTERAQKTQNIKDNTEYIINAAKEHGVNPGI